MFLLTLFGQFLPNNSHKTIEIHCRSGDFNCKASYITLIFSLKDELRAEQICSSDLTLVELHFVKAVVYELWARRQINEARECTFLIVNFPMALYAKIAQFFCVDLEAVSLLKHFAKL